MENPWDEVRAAVSAGRQMQRAIQSHAVSLADLLAGNLRHVDSATLLRQLKRELRDFDMTTVTWKK